MAVIQPIDRPGTGLYPVSVPTSWSEFGWLNVRGGSSGLAESIAETVLAHGGHICTRAEVRRIIIENGRASGVETSDGHMYRARRAIVSSAHFTNLPEMATGSIPQPFIDRTRTWRAGPSLFVVHLALRSNQRVRTRGGSLPAVLGGKCSTEGVAAQLENTRAGRLTTNDPWMLLACSTWIDPSRAPEGQGTLKIITHAPYALDGDANRWDAARDEYADYLVEEYAKAVVDFAPGDELGRRAMSPLDLERTNPSFHRGAAQGGEMLPDQAGENRPVAGWANYRMPIPGLYQTGTSSHPGGPVSGWPGRHAARAVLEDLQIDWARVVSHPSRKQAPEVPIIDTSTF